MTTVWRARRLSRYPWPVRLKLFAAVPALALLGAFLYTHRDWPRYWALRREGAPARGWVIGKSEGRRRLVYYAFQGPKKVQTDAGEAGFGNPEFDELGEGDPVTVYFLPSRPEVSMLGLPDERLIEQHTLLVWGLIASIAGVVWAFRRELRRQAP
jgi:hypothetical protein